MTRRGALTRRLGEIHRIGMESGEGSAALAAAVLTQAIHDARQGIAGSGSDPAAARAWLRSTGRCWLELLRPAVRPAGGMSGQRIA